MMKLIVIFSAFLALALAAPFDDKSGQNVDGRRVDKLIKELDKVIVDIRKSGEDVTDLALDKVDQLLKAIEFELLPTTRDGVNEVGRFVDKVVRRKKAFAVKILDTLENVYFNLREQQMALTDKIIEKKQNVVANVRSFIGRLKRVVHREN